MADINNGELEIAKKVTEWKSYICRAVRSPRVLDWMPNTFSQADVREVKDIDKHQSPSKATYVFIGKLMKCTAPGKWTSFCQALEDSDYGYLASLLTSKCGSLENCRHQKKMLQIFAPYLDMLDPIALISHLSATGLVNNEDREEIITRQQSQGSVASTMLMLDRIQRRKAPSVWYKEFLKALLKNGYDELVMDMEPDFTLDCEVLKVPSIVFTDSSESDVETNGTSYLMREDTIEQKVVHLKSYISELVTVDKLLPSLCSIISIDRICHISQPNFTRKEAMDSVLEDIAKLKSKTKWTSFVDCLRKSDYPHVAELLTRPRSYQTLQTEKCLLNLFTPTLGAQLEPILLLPYLETEGAINKRDKEEIENTYHSLGAMAASSVLLDCMQCRLPPRMWYKVFLQSLIRCGRQDLVENIDPDFAKRLNIDSNDQEEIDNASEDQVLLEELEKAYFHVHKVYKANEREFTSIRNHFRTLEVNLANEVEQRYQSLIKTLDDISERIKGMKNSSVECHDSEKASITNCLTDITSKVSHINPDKHFMNVKQLAVMQHSVDRLSKNSNECHETISAVDRRKLFARRRQLSVGSSSSSQSSGFAFVGWHMPISQYSSSASEKSPRVSFSNEVKQSTKKSYDTHGPPQSEAKIKGYGLTNRRRCLSESSVLSTDGSLCSSVERASSHNTEGKVDSSSISSTITKVSAISEKKPIERTDSILYHQGFVLPKLKKCLLSNICALPCKQLVLLNDLKSSVCIFDEITRKYKEFHFSRWSPVKVCALQESYLFVLLQRRDGATKLCQYDLQCSNTKCVDNISLKSEFSSNNKCHDSLCAIASTKEKIVGFCQNKHLHILSQDLLEENVVSLDIQVQEWWPHLCAVDSGCNSVFVYDVYLSNIYCFTDILRVTKNGISSPIWTKRVYAIEGMVVCGDHLYVSMNAQCMISRFIIANGNADKPLRENVQRPFALSCIPGQDTIIVTQYHPEGTKVNRTVRYF